VTAVPLPQSTSVVAAWSLVDWLDRPYISAPAAADGTALITLDALADNERWSLTHAVIGAVTLASNPQMRFYFDAVSNPNLRDGSRTGAFDVGDWPAGLKIPPGRALLARWTGLNPGDVAFLTLQADIYRRVS
jgi:hypothetical protein